MRREEEAERLLLPLVELLPIVCDRRNRRALLAEWAGASAGDGLRLVEDRPLAELRVLLRLRARALRLRQDLEHSRARGAERVERARLDEALDRALVDRAAVHALAEVPDRRERPACLARGDDRVDGRAAHALHGLEPEANVAADDDEVVAGLVD